MRCKISRFNEFSHLVYVDVISVLLTVTTAAEFAISFLSQFSDTEWSAPYTYNVLRTLEKKGLICEYGRIRYKTQYMREYVATQSKEEFYIRLAYANHVNPVEYINQATLFAIHEMPQEQESILQTISAIIVEINTTKIR